METEIDPARIVREHVIAGGGYWSCVIARGSTLRLVDLEGSRGVSALFYNADQPSERYNAPDTVKIQNTIFPSAGRVLFSDLGRVLMSITADTCGSLDTLGGGSTDASVAARHGAGGYQELRNGWYRSAHMNFAMALGRHGMDRRDVVPCINFFSRVAVDPDGALRFVEVAKAGTFVDLRAEMNVLAVISNTPHPLHPETKYDPRPIRALVWTAPPPRADDPCRTGSPEAIRGFENTDALFA